MDKSYKNPTRLRDQEKVKEWHRKCQRCGKSAYPNYFYCPYCHQYVVNKDDKQRKSKLRSRSGSKKNIVTE